MPEEQDKIIKETEQAIKDLEKKKFKPKKGAKKTKEKVKSIVLRLEPNKVIFTAIWPFKTHEDNLEYGGVQDLRQLLSNEKVRILHTIKTKNPDSIYKLSKILARDFKSVRQDVKLLEKFGLVKLEWQGKTRKRLKPSLAINELNITLKL